MDCAYRNATTTRVLTTFFRPRQLRIQQQHLLHRHQLASYPRTQTRSYASPSPPDPKKPIVLEQPDKFRPPSHGARRNARSSTNTYGAGAYNQNMTAAQLESSKTKSYPHMFPPEGSRMYWFLTTRWVHVVFTFTVLAILGTTSAILTWASTTPFAYLIPPKSMLLTSPLNYISELWSVHRLHIEYTTQRTAEHRQQKILDAQKQRLYRRAHGLEDLTAQEVSGPDVRGLVEWDDGLTGPQRERGGVYTGSMLGTSMQDMGIKPGETFSQLMERRRGEEVDEAAGRTQRKIQEMEQEAREEEERLIRIGAKKAPAQQQEEKKRGGLYFGIWG